MLCLHNRTHARANLGPRFFLTLFLLVCSLSLFSFKSESLPVSLSVLPAHGPSPNPFLSLRFTVTPVSGPGSTVLPRTHNMAFPVGALMPDSGQLHPHPPALPLVNDLELVQLVLSIPASPVSS